MASELDDLLNDLQSTQPAQPQRQQSYASRSQPQRTQSSASSELDDLLNDLGGAQPAQPQRQQSSVSRSQPQRTQSGAAGDLDDLLNDLQGAQPAQPQRQQSSVSRAQPQRTQSGTSELDDLLNDLGGGQPQSQPQPSSVRSQTQRTQTVATSGKGDGLDDLLNDLSQASVSQPQRQQPSSVRSQPQRTQTATTSDLDDLLNDLKQSSAAPATQSQQRTTTQSYSYQPPRQQSSSSYSDSLSTGGKGDELDNLLRSQSSGIEAQRRANEDINALLKDESRLRVTNTNAEAALRKYAFSSGVLKFETEQLAGSANIEGYRFNIYAKREASNVFPNFFAYRLSNIKMPNPIDFDWSPITWEHTTKDDYEKVMRLKLRGMVDPGTALDILVLFPPFHEPPILSLGPIDIAPLRNS